VENNVSKALWISTYQEVLDPEAFTAYAKVAGPALKAAGGRTIVRSNPAKTFEGGLDQRVVVIEFDSAAEAIAAYESAEYQAARKILKDTVVRDIRIVEIEE
jgi:uncharacterized protein (DUF1330 family)